MDKFVITGGAALQGEIPTNGSKNSALPALAAALLTDQPVTLHRVPRVRDIRTMERLLVDIGTTVDVEDETVRLRSERILSPEAPYELVKTMRASSLVLGPLVARSGRARVSLPGGCAIGTRPINLHIFGLEQLGATINQAHGYIEAVAPHGLRGAMVNFDRITVTGTEDLMMAAVLARGETVLRNAAREPEVADLAGLLIKMGASIEGAGASTIRIPGVEGLHGAGHTTVTRPGALGGEPPPGPCADRPDRRRTREPGDRGDRVDSRRAHRRRQQPGERDRLDDDARCSDQSNQYRRGDRATYSGDTNEAQFQRTSGQRYFGTTTGATPESGGSRPGPGRCGPSATGRTRRRRRTQYVHP